MSIDSSLQIAKKMELSRVTWNVFSGGLLAGTHRPTLKREMALGYSYLQPEATRPLRGIENSTREG